MTEKPIFSEREGYERLVRTETDTRREEMIDKREANLPKWARDELALLRMRRDEAEAKVRALFPEAPTNTHWLEGFQKERPLPTNATVRFRLGPDDFEFVEARVDSKGALYISGGRVMIINPVASNAITLRLLE